MIIFRCSVLLTALTLTACGSGQDDKICSTPPKRSTAIGVSTPTSIEQMAVTNGCIHNWAYRLASAPGSNREIADAVIGGCRDAIILESNLAVHEDTGKKTTQATEAAQFELSRKIYFDSALFHVVQARAGKCNIP